MNCPHCLVPLTMTDRQGIEIDYCPQCRGVWLDRGELDKLIERSSVGAAVAAPTPRAEAISHREPVRRYDDDDDDYRRTHGHSDDYYKKKKRKGFLGELFDFD